MGKKTNHLPPVFHYTVSVHLKNILSVGYLKLSGQTNPTELPAVWLSINPIWDGTVRKAILHPATGRQTEPLPRDEMIEFGITPIRFEIDRSKVDLYNWKHYRKKSRRMTSDTELNFLEKVARDWKSNPKEWRVSYKPIPLSAVKEISIWNNGEWIPTEVIKV